MFASHYKLYQRCFPDYPLSYEDFCGIAELGSGAVLTEETEGGRLIGYAVTERPH